MARKPEKVPVKWLTTKELNKVIQNKKVCAKVLRKLLFMKQLYKGSSVPQASEEVGVSKVIGYNWLKKWNEEGIEGLEPKYGGGRPPELSQKEKEELKEILKERDDWSTKGVKHLIEEEFGVDYSERHVNRMLKKFGLKHAKPYQQDYRRPDNADEKLKKNLMND